MLRMPALFLTALNCCCAVCDKAIRYKLQVVTHIHSMCQRFLLTCISFERPSCTVPSSGSPSVAGYPLKKGTLLGVTVLSLYTLGGKTAPGPVVNAYADRGMRRGYQVKGPFTRLWGLLFVITGVGIGVGMSRFAGRALLMSLCKAAAPKME
jgi:hypothetical protein